MKADVVEVFEDVPRAGTFLIAQGFQREHKMVTKLIEKYRSDFEEFGTLKVRKVMTKGRPVIEFWLNEEQFFLLGSYMRNTDVVRLFKKRLVKEFFKLRRKLDTLQKYKLEPEYKRIRVASKIIRRDATDVMKEFCEYAKGQGSTNHQRYYSNITRMLNGMMFIVKGKFKNVREVLTTQQLMTVGTGEQIIMKGLEEGMKHHTHYKVVYQDIKEKVALFAELHGKSEVISKFMELAE